VGSEAGRLFATEGSVGTIATVDPTTGKIAPFITEVQTGQLAFRDGWIYWGAGSMTNNGVVSRSGLASGGVPDIPCQDIKLSDNVFASGDGVFTSGCSLFGQQK
jgi:hypothetical protein